MNRRFVLLAVTVSVTLLIASCATTPKVTVTGVDIVGYGLYEKVNVETRVHKGRDVEKKKIEVPLVSVKDLRLLKQTDQIPLAAGTSFGVQYVVKGYPDAARVPLTVTIISPHGNLTIKYKDRLIGTTYRIGRTFKSTANAKPGQYGYEFSCQGEKLAEQKFTVYQP